MVVELFALGWYMKQLIDFSRRASGKSSKAETGKAWSNRKAEMINELQGGASLS